MTCRHVLDIIDAGPFADIHRPISTPRGSMAPVPDAGRHCRRQTVLTIDLAALPQPVPLPDLAAAVVARIGRIARIEIEGEPPVRARARDWSP